MSNKVYDILKWVAQIILPAIGTLYFALASIWGLPYAEQIVGTITAVDAFLGAVLGVSTSMYNKNTAKYADGVLLVDGKDTHVLTIDKTTEELANKDKLVIAVEKTERK